MSTNFIPTVKFPDGSIENSNSFIESPPIKGSVPIIIKQTMEKPQDMVIVDKVTKLPGQMESVRRFSFSGIDGSVSMEDIKR